MNVGLNDSGFIGRVDFPGRSGAGFLTINGDPYFVIDALGLGPGSTTGTDLQGINGNLSGHYALGGDLDASETAGGPWLLGGRAGLLPIGTSTAGFEFKGSFNGLGHVITNLYTERTSASHVDGGMTITTVYGGLFGYTTASSNISNLGLAGGSTGSVNGCAFAPCIAGSLVAVNFGSVSNSWSTREVIAGGDAGGLVGRNHGSVRNSFAQGDVQSQAGFDAAGGLVGTNVGAIVDSRAGGTAKGNGETGGLAGRNFGSITRSHATTTVTTLGGGQSLGGLVGYNAGSITDSDAAATVTGNPAVMQFLGGLVGMNDGTIASSHAESTVSGEGGTGPVGGLVGWNMGNITDSRAGGSVDTGAGSTSTAGGLVGRNGGAIVNSHYDVDSLLLNGSHQLTYGGLYGPQYQDWLGHAKALAIGDYAASLPYNGATGYHEIASVQGLRDLLGFSELPGLRFRLTADLDLSVAPGLYIPAFAAAEFDGAGHVLSNLAVAPPTSQVGLFGSLASGSTLRNITVQNASVGGLDDLGALVGASRGTVMNSHASGTVTGGVSSAFLGGLVGSTAAGASIQDSDAAVAVSGGASAGAVGGLVGQNNGSIARSHATGTVTAGADSAGIGGLAGMSGGVITGSYATGGVTADGGVLVGGLVGSNNGTITNSYATGAVSGSSTLTGSSFGVGGLVGYHSSGSISDSYATGDVKGVDTVGGLVGQSDAAISNTYAAGKVEGSSALGGLVGVASSFGSIAGSYWNVDTAGPSVAPDGMERTTAQMQSALTFAGWDIASTGGTTSTWRIYEGHTAPLLRSFLTPLAVTPAYDGSGTPLATASAYVLPGGTDSSQVLGTVGDTLTISSTGAAGSYLASVDFSGLYSSQSGYDILATPRTIATPGSAAGDVRLDNPITWSSGTVNITAANNVDLNGQALASTGGAFAFNAGNQIVNAGSVAVNLFDLQGGTWNQVITTLPSFTATDFRISGGTFVRALGGDGTTASPYQLADIYGVQGIGSAGMTDKSHVLAGDIDAAGTATWNAGAGFAPMVLDASGSFDGQGHTIAGLRIDRPGEGGVGLFSFNQGTVANVGLDGGRVTGGSDVGAIAGWSGGRLVNVHSTATVIGGNWVGGLVGSNAGEVQDSHAAGEVTASGGQAGGLAGSNFGTIARSHAAGAVNADLSQAGGLVGENDGTIEDSYATGDVLAGEYAAGGLVGRHLGGSIARSYATGKAEATIERAGGLVGHLFGAITDSYATGDVTGGATGDVVGGLVGYAGDGSSVTNSYASGAVTGRLSLGGLIGQRESAAATVTNSFWDAQASGQSTSQGGIARTTAQMQAQASFGGWDFSGTWVQYEGHTRPLLRSFLTPFTVTANDATKTYDGQAYDGSAGLRYSAAPDLASLLGTPSYASGVNAGTHAITPGGLYSHQQGYLISFVDGTLTVDPKALTITGMTARDKVYDGNATAQFDGGTLAGLVGSETLGFSASGNFDSPNAGNGKPVTVTGVSLADGTGLASNYTVTLPTGLTANIDPKTLTLVGLTANNKVYDQSAAAVFTGGTLDGLVGGETLGFSATGNFDTPNAGNGKPVTVTAVNLADGTGLATNYTVTLPTGLLASIDPAQLTLTGLSANNKVYDQGTAASFSGGTLNGLLGGDTLGFSATGNFDNPNAGNGKPVTLTAINLADGTGLASNYTVTLPSGLSANIDPAQLTLTGLMANNKVYDQSTAATFSGGSLNGLLPGETLGFSATGNFNNANAGNGKPVAVTAVDLADGTGLASNYSVAVPTGLSANIDPRTLNVTATGVDKVYDRTTAATVNFTDDRLAGDQLAIGGTASSFRDANAGTGKTVDVGSVTLSGADAGNYTLAVNATTSANITPAALLVAVQDEVRIADGQAFSGPGTLRYTGLLPGDDASLLLGLPTWSGTAIGASLPGRYSLSVAGSGFSTANYDIRYADGVLTLVPGQNPRTSGEAERMARQDVEPPPAVPVPTRVRLSILPDFVRVD